MLQIARNGRKEGKNCHLAFGQFHGCRHQRGGAAVESDICDQNLLEAEKGTWHSGDS